MNITYKVRNFFENWIYPGYYLTNCLFKRFDLIKLPMYKSYQYVEICDKIKYSNFELIKQFIEKENPEKYVCWYEDQQGKKVGPIYGEIIKWPILYPQLKGKWIMDIIKEIYNFYTIELPKLNYEHEYLLTFWNQYIWNYHLEYDTEQLTSLTIDHPIYKSYEDLKEQNIDWNIIEKYLNKKDIFEENKLFQITNNLEVDIQKKIQYYLHLCIEVRQYLWI